MPWTATIRDISSTGVGLLGAAQFARGTILVIKLEDHTDRFARPLLVRVVRTIKQADGAWLNGCTFASKVSPEDLALLIQAAEGSEALPG